MAISKSDGVSIAASGVELTYTLTVRNNGSEGATGVVISDVLPAHVTYVAGSASPAFTKIETTPAPGPPTGMWSRSPGRFQVNGLRVLNGRSTFRVIVEDPMPQGVTRYSILPQCQMMAKMVTIPTPDDNSTSDLDYLATLPNTNLSKTLAGTSEASTLLQNVAIGETLSLPR